MPKQAEEDDDEYGHCIVDPEVAQVPLDAGHGLVVAVRACEG